MREIKQSAIAFGVFCMSAVSANDSKGSPSFQTKKDSGDLSVHANVRVCYRIE